MSLLFCFEFPLIGGIVSFIVINFSSGNAFSHAENEECLISLYGYG